MTMGWILGRKGEVREMQNEIVLSILASLIVSVIYNKISAAYTFKVIDGYVKDVIGMVKELIRDARVDKGAP